MPEAVEKLRRCHSFPSSSVDLGEKEEVESIQETEAQEEYGAREVNEANGDLLSDEASADDRDRRASGVAERAADHGAQHVLTRAQDQNAELRAVAPLGAENEQEGLGEHTGH